MRASPIRFEQRIVVASRVAHRQRRSPNGRSAIASSRADRERRRWARMHGGLVRDGAAAGGRAAKRVLQPMRLERRRQSTHAGHRFTSARYCSSAPPLDAPRLANARPVRYCRERRVRRGRRQRQHTLHGPPLTRPTRRPSPMHFAFVITLSAFLIFLVQPLIAKQILPWFGGTAAVWTTCMVFFQSALLAGYAYADWAPRRLGIARQARCHAVLALLALVALPISRRRSGSRPTAPRRSFTSWACSPRRSDCPTSCSRRRVRSCRRGSPARIRPRSVPALRAVEFRSLPRSLCYPFVLEPRFALREQAMGWSALYALFVVASRGSRCALRAPRPTKALRASSRSVGGPVGRSATGHESAVGTSTDAATRARPRGRAPSTRNQLWWLLLAATASALLLAITNHVTENIASVPLLWLHAADALPAHVHPVLRRQSLVLARGVLRPGADGDRARWAGYSSTATHQFDLLVESVVFGAGLFASACSAMASLSRRSRIRASRPLLRDRRIRRRVRLGRRGARRAFCASFVLGVCIPSRRRGRVARQSPLADGRGARSCWRSSASSPWSSVAHLHMRNDLKDAIWMGRNFYGALKVRAYEKPDSENYHRRLVARHHPAWGAIPGAGVA